MGSIGAFVVVLFILAAIYAPFLASSKPIAVQYDGAWYFPLFRYLFYQGFYSKPLDLFFNVLMFLFPFFLL
ncbi:MAG: ABC transporter permease, partial [Parachlamydiaceae bacterium]